MMPVRSWTIDPERVVAPSAVAALRSVPALMSRPVPPRSSEGPGPHRAAGEVHTRLGAPVVSARLPNTELNC